MSKAPGVLLVRLLFTLTVVLDVAGWYLAW
jgi:hypothetical protein